MNWLDVAPGTAVSCAMIGPVMRAGSRSGSPSSSIVTPIDRRAANWSPIGRWRICSWASTTTGASLSAASGTANRAVVPDWLADTWAATPGSSPPQPSTSIVAAARSTRVVIPSPSRTLSIASVSSANRAPRRTLVPSARAAHTSARLVMLFDPGSTTVVSGGAASGVIGKGSTSVMLRAAASTAGTRAPSDRPGTVRPWPCRSATR